VDYNYCNDKLTSYYHLQTAPVPLAVEPLIKSRAASSLRCAVERNLPTLKLSLIGIEQGCGRECKKQFIERANYMSEKWYGIHRGRWRVHHWTIARLSNEMVEKLEILKVLTYGPFESRREAREACKAEAFIHGHLLRLAPRKYLRALDASHEISSPMWKKHTKGVCV
jgi:hypothetical protein